MDRDNVSGASLAQDGTLKLDTVYFALIETNMGVVVIVVSQCLTSL